MQLRHTYAARFLRTESIALVAAWTRNCRVAGLPWIVVAEVEARLIRLEFLGLTYNPNPHYDLMLHQPQNHMQMQHDVDSPSRGILNKTMISLLSLPKPHMPLPLTAPGGVSPPPPPPF